MIASLLDWIDNRTGIRGLIQAALYEHVPGGARWRYVWGSTLVFAFAVQAITGVCLWMCYSPSSQTAWESVYYVQYEMQGGWLLRGVHHFMAQAMVVLLCLHLLQVVIDGAYRAPREFNFWLGLVLMHITLGLSLTGYLLPWDQKGYWATQVATNIAGLVPVMGEPLQKLVIGGSEYGHHTLTRFFALHAGVLPAALVFFLVLHIAIFRKHGLHAKQPIRKPDSMFWPDQVLRDGVACLAVLLVVLLLVVKPLWPFFGEHTVAEAVNAAHPGDFLGAELGAPADPAKEYSAARPEWYFLFLFQFLKFFSSAGETGEIVGAIIVPGAVMATIGLMPLLGLSKWGHRFNIAFIVALLAGALGLTCMAWRDDNYAKLTEPEDTEAYKASTTYLAAVEEAETESRRAVELARSPQGIGSQGAKVLLRSDPKSQGKFLFRSSCAVCHEHVDAEGEGIASAFLSAPNQYGFGSEAWIAGLLDPERISTDRYFGNTKHKDGQMAEFVRAELSSPAGRAHAKSIAALLAEQAATGKLPEAKAAELEGLLSKPMTSMACTDCHRFNKQGQFGAEGNDTGPDLTGYASAEWIRGMILNPAHKDFYGEGNDRMPSAQGALSETDIDLLVKFLRHEWYIPESEAAAE